MDNFEKVEKLREHANVTYEEAKEALENSNWDILDAMIYLEKNGKTRESQRAEYSTKTERCVGEVIDDGKEERRSNFKDSMHRFAKWCSHILDMGNSNSFCVEKDDKEIFRIPITVLVLLLLFDPKLFHCADLYAVLGGGQHLNLQKQHKYVKNNLANVQKIIKEDVVLGDCTALKIKNRRQHTVQQH